MKPCRRVRQHSVLRSWYAVGRQIQDAQGWVGYLALPPTFGLYNPRGGGQIADERDYVDAIPEYHAESPLADYRLLTLECHAGSPGWQDESPP